MNDKLFGILVVLFVTSGCFLAPKKPIAEPDQIEETAEEESQPEQPSEPVPEQVPFPEIKSNKGDSSADQARKLQDTKIPELVSQKVEEIKKAAAEGFRVYTETTSNGIRAAKMANEFQKRGFRVKVLKITPGETYQLVITW